jgi:hypothetical protein
MIMKNKHHLRLSFGPRGGTINVPEEISLDYDARGQ